jgi:drug/metabolite transporter (DMT)-like permease
MMHLWMLGATFFWAANLIAIKQSLTGFHALALTQLRITLAGTVFLVLLLATRRFRRLGLSRRDWVFIFFIGVTGVTLNQVCFIVGLERSSASHAGLIVALGPIMVLVLSCTIGLEALTVSKFAGMLIAFGGVAILTTARSGQGSHAAWWGDLLLLAGSGVFALYTILMKEVADRFDAVTINALAYMIGVPLMLPFAAHAVGQVHWGEVPTHAWWGLGYAVLFGSVVPYLIFAVVLTELTAARVAAFSYIQPVIATSLGVLMLHERLSVRLFIGGTLILTGLYLTERERGDEPLLKSAEEAVEGPASTTTR